MQRLHCTQDVSQAQQVIAELCLPKRAWPLVLPQDQRVEVLDALLWTMDQAARRFPSLTAPIEECVLSWNLCKLRTQRQWVDRIAEEVTCVPTPPTPAGWLGLKQWGLVADSQVQRRIPTRLRPAAPERAAYPQQLHLSYHQHCFPHPITGRLFDEETRPTAYGGQGAALGVALCAAPARPAVALRDRLCPSPPQPPSDARAVAAPLVVSPALKPTTGASSLAPRSSASVLTTLKPPRSALPASPSVTPHLAAPSAMPEDDAATVTPDLASVQPDVPPPAAEPVMLAAPTTVPTPAVAPSSAALTSAHDPAFGRLPATGASSTLGTSHASAATPPGAHGFSGAFSHDWPLNGSGRKLSATVTWAPAEYWFIRLGLANAYEQKGSQPWSYSWGVGYDDWHPGTWSVQLNQWGPIAPGKGLDIKNAVFTTSYKTDHAWLKERDMSLTHGIDLPVGQPRNGKLHSTWQWAPWPTWFVRVGVSAPLRGLSPLQWSYGFGRSDWRPFTWSLEYNNWGPNTAFQPNFKKNGTVTLAWKWAY